MAKKKSWFYRLKRLFVSETHCRLETDKRRRSRRCAFGFLAKRRLASLSAPAPPPGGRLNTETESDDQSRLAANEAIAKAAASDAVFPANQVAAEVVCGSCNSQSALQFKDANGKLLSDDVCAKEIQVLAAIKIQTAFRAYIARKALRALKGLVRLQAVIRGRAVRRQAITTLKCLQTIVNIQSEVCAKRCEMVKSTLHSQENKLVDLQEKDIKIDLNSQRKWDDSPLSKEEANALCMSKREAEIKRDRIKEYWSSHRRSAESDQCRVSARRRYWLEQWVDAQLAKREDFHNLDAVNSAKARIRDQLGSRQLRLRKFLKDYDTDQGFDSPLYVPRRSFHRKQHSIGEDTSFAESPAIPAYMAATESAKAKTRSMSSPRLRPINIDAYSEINSPYKHKLSPISSINSDATSISRVRANPTGLSSQRSPCLKGLPGPVKSKRSLKHLSLNSDVSMPTWDRPGAYRLYT